MTSPHRSVPGNIPHTRHLAGTLRAAYMPPLRRNRKQSCGRGGALLRPQRLLGPYSDLNE